MIGEHMTTQPPLLIVLGPTAIGKTDLAIQLARHFDGEIVGADSRQIYHHMDVGTAKPTKQQQSIVPHHLIDFTPPDQTPTLAQIQRMAYNAMAAIHARGKVPMLVGGTGQYITAIEEGWSIPEVPPDEALREELEAEAEVIGYAAFHRKLSTIDPEAANKIHPNNVRRVVRALEVYHHTGTPISDLQRKQPPPYRIRSLGLYMEREALHRRAEQRVDSMIEAGFLEEVQNLLEMGYSPDLKSMSALGYRELAAHLQGETTLAEAVEQTKISTRQFIRKQETWFRGHDNGILWHNMSYIDHNELQHALDHWLHSQE